MPVLDGFETTRRIHAALLSECPPIIAVTAATQGDDIKRGKAAGMKGVLPKPISLKGIAKLLGDLDSFASLLKKNSQKSFRAWKLLEMKS